MPLYAYNRENRALVLFSPDGRPQLMIGVQHLQPFWKVDAAGLREALPQYPPSVIDVAAVNKQAAAAGPSTPLAMRRASR